MEYITNPFPINPLFWNSVITYIHVNDEKCKRHPSMVDIIDVSSINTRGTNSGKRGAAALGLKWSPGSECFNIQLTELETVSSMWEYVVMWDNIEGGAGTACMTEVENISDEESTTEGERISDEEVAMKARKT
ncbi:hypothetical protein FKW77_010190 [Venturia effusa]|uniref:Uncharacterized protein n=1 Tax=Venturia effusa TaxID=50376 RepID=A0A517KXL1_9PEZI|nr:hypothetical protein FKW77_010190 [Venturia effusa]